MAVKPIKPSEVAAKKEEAIPDGVLEEWNNAIATNWSGTEAIVKQNDIVRAIVHRMGVKRHEVFDRRWLDIEPIYRQAGWTVVYDKPGYNETYEAFFLFKK